jgi:hypothetical protein
MSGLVLELEKLDAGEIGANIGRAVAGHLRQPENLAGLAGSVLLPMMVFRGARVPVPLLFLTCLAGEAAGRMAYRASRNLEILARAAQDDA